MKTATKQPPTIQLTKKGVYLVKGDARTKVAAPIKLWAVFTYQSDGTSGAEIRFTNFYNERITEKFKFSDFLPRDRHLIVERLANRDYIWPSDTRLIYQIIDVLKSNRPDRRYTIVGAPGWYDGDYVTKDWQVGDTRRYKLDKDSGANLAAFRTGTGSFGGWKKAVGKIGIWSSVLRLSLGAALAAPLLRPLNVDSFGLNFFGETSQGKSSVEVAAASVSGLITEGGLPGWADTTPAIEQLAVGHRDNILPLDDAAEGESRELKMEDKFRQVAYAIARNRTRNVDKKHMKNSNLLVRDYRIIVLSSSEFALGAIASKAGKPRKGGERVRLIDVPATFPGSHGIFDGELHGKTSIAETAKLVDRLRLDSELNQGFALRRFLKKFKKDARAVSTLKGYMVDFETRATAPILKNADRRILKNFAVIYAAAALAIDYEILPWKHTATLKAIDKCMTASFQAAGLLEEHSDPMSDVATIALRLKASLETLNIIEITKGVKPHGDEVIQRRGADGFKIENNLLIKSKSWKGLSTADRKMLSAHDILRTEKRPDALSVSKKIAGIKEKLRYYIVDTTILEQMLNSVSPR
jgi:Domain of unknown function (DUF927)